MPLASCGFICYVRGRSNSSIRCYYFVLCAYDFILIVLGLNIFRILVLEAGFILLQVFSNLPMLFCSSDRGPLLPLGLGIFNSTIALW